VELEGRNSEGPAGPRESNDPVSGSVASGAPTGELAASRATGQREPEVRTREESGRTTVQAFTIRLIRPWLRSGQRVDGPVAAQMEWWKPKTAF
jgi:hypothetical protein